MSGTLFDLPPPRPARPRHHIFLAAIPPAEVAREMEAAWHLAGTGERFRAGTLHLTVLPVMMLAEPEPQLLQRIQSVLDRLALHDFALVFDRIVTFNGTAPRRPVVLGCAGESEELSALAATLQGALAAAGLMARSRPRVTPHVTLAYGRGHDEARLLPSPISWRVTCITLLDSPQGEGRHISHGTWPLAPRPDI